MYDPLVGRFLQQDVSGYSDGLNTYQFVDGSPESYYEQTAEEPLTFALVVVVTAVVSWSVGYKAGEDYRLYQQRGFSGWEAAVASAGGNIPVVNAGFSAYEIGAGKSLRAQDLNRSLTDVDNAERLLGIELDIGLILLGGGAPEAGLTRQGTAAARLDRFVAADRAAFALRQSSVAANQLAASAVGDLSLLGRSAPLSAAKLDRFAQEIKLRFGTDLLSNDLAPATLKLRPRDAARFTVYREGTTGYWLLHEYEHLNHFQRIGFQEFNALSETAAEQFVYDQMRIKYWSRLTDLERRNATFQVIARGGFAW
jgi:hypothetical protein